MSRAAVDARWQVTRPVPGGPIDGTVIPSFLGHVASRMWDGEMRGVLKLQNKATVCHRLVSMRDRMSEETRALVDGTGLGHLLGVMFAHIDHPLLCAFVERWQSDTNTFHMPFGEITIMLHDVWHILRVPVEGRVVSTDLD